MGDNSIQNMENGNTSEMQEAFHCQEDNQSEEGNKMKEKDRRETQRKKRTLIYDFRSLITSELF